MAIDVKKKELEIDLKDTAEKALEAEVVDKGYWSNQADFLLSLLGYAVGLGNVWRFPYLCYKNGGGAFLIPYVIMLFLVGIPVFVIELALGQFSSNATLTCFEFALAFRGIGIAMLIVSFLICLYYNVIIAWSIRYLFYSFSAPLPWEKCGNYSTPSCLQKWKNITEVECLVLSGVPAEDGVCRDRLGKAIAVYNRTLSKLSQFEATFPSKDFFDYVGMRWKKSPSLGELGILRWDMSLCLLLAWIIIGACLWKGVKSSGKVVYFTAIFPYVVLLALFVFGLRQDGHEMGINYYLKANFTKLTDSTVWKDAAVQIFFSISTTTGGIITLASYNRFRTDLVRDAIFVSIANCATSFFAGFVVFSYIGFLAKQLDLPVEQVIDEGPGLAFVVYPQAATRLPLPTLWSILFFTMLITLGLDSQFTFVETLVTSILDYAPKFRKQKKWVFIGLCLIGFACGLPMCTEGGIYLLTVFDTYAGGWSMLLICLLECIAVVVFYGVNRFTHEIDIMINKSFCFCFSWQAVKWYFIFCWCISSPILVTFILVFSIAKFRGASFAHNPAAIPMWGQGIGWIMTVACLLGLVLPFFYSVARIVLKEKEKRRAIVALFKPTAKWGPKLDSDRILAGYTLEKIPLEDPPEEYTNITRF